MWVYSWLAVLVADGDRVGDLPPAGDGMSRRLASVCSRGRRVVRSRCRGRHVVLGATAGYVLARTRSPTRLVALQRHALSSCSTRRCSGVPSLLAAAVRARPSRSPDLPWPQRVLSVLLRIAFVALLGARPVAPGAHGRRPQKVCTVYIDRRHRLGARRGARQTRREASSRRRSPEADRRTSRCKVVTFARAAAASSSSEREGRPSSRR